MNNQFDELTKSLAQSVTGRAALTPRMRGGLGLAGMAVACFGLLQGAYAQTSVVCDADGDEHYGNGKGGPEVPAWLDVVRATITDAGDNILFTLTVNEPIPLVPAWNNAEDGGQFWWSWRLVGDLADLTFVSNGCLQAKGKNVPACYCLDVIWSIQASSFRARLLDDTSCTEIAVPLVFSSDRRETSMLVAKSLFTNIALIPDPNSFQYLTETIVWKANSNGNMSLTTLDDAPSQVGGGFILGTWSSSNNTAYGCP